MAIPVNVPKYPAIGEPTYDPDSLRGTAMNLKETVEILTRQRGDPINSAITWGDLVALGLITKDDVPTLASKK